MFLLTEIDKLMYCTPLELNAVYNVYHEMLLENATHETNHKAQQHVEEFLANTVYLLELGMEQDARLQLETAQFILRRAKNNNILVEKMIK